MDHQAQIWKIFQKHQTILDDIQDLHFHFDDFKNGIEKEFAFFERSHFEKRWKFSVISQPPTDTLPISMLTCEQYI